MKVSLLLVMLSILSQAYTLPPLRDDLALIPYQIQKFSDPAHLAKRQIRVATLYWDRNGNIKAVFNLQISYVVARVVENEGVNLAQSVATAFQTYATMTAGPESAIFTGAVWASQIGVNWRDILQQRGGSATIGILVILHPALRSYQHTAFVLQLMQFWFNLSGYMAFPQEVEDAARAYNEGRNQIERRAPTEGQTVEARSDSKFCKPTIQNGQFVFTPGKLDTLLAPLITC